MRLPLSPALLAVPLALLAGCNESSSTPKNNLTLNDVFVVGSPRIGYPVELVADVSVLRQARDVTLSVYALNGADVANQIDPPRQFYVGSTTFPLVHPDISQYPFEVTIPENVDLPGDYVLSCTLDPSDLIPETIDFESEALTQAEADALEERPDDNVVEIAVILAPMEDPNVFLEDVILDRTTILLDRDEEEDAAADPNDDDVYNSDAGGTLVVGVEGVLDDVPVEVSAALRIRRSDVPPAMGEGFHYYDVPLYLWDGVDERYVNVFEEYGAVEWLPIGDVSPRKVDVNAAPMPDEPEVEFEHSGKRQARLDVYYPGRLADLMIRALAPPQPGLPPTDPPPDLPEAVIDELLAFLPAPIPAPEVLSFTAVVRVRTVGSPCDGVAGTFEPGCDAFDDDEADNQLERDVILVLPGETPPNAPVEFAEGLDATWDDDDFGVGIGFDSMASLDERGAIAQVSGGVPVKLLGFEIDFLEFDARAQVVPAVAPNVVPDGEDSGFFLTLDFVDQTIFSMTRALNDSLVHTEDFTRSRTRERLFFVGPVPIEVSATIGGSIGFTMGGELEPVSLASAAGPYANLTASASAGVSYGDLFGAGFGTDLTIVDERFTGSVTTGLLVLDDGFGDDEAIFTGTVLMDVRNVLTGPNGRVFIYGEYPTIRWKRRCACFGGCCFSYPSGFRTVRKELDLVVWHSFEKTDVLFHEELCRAATVTPDSASFGGCP